MFDTEFIKRCCQKDSHAIGVYTYRTTFLKIIELLGQKDRKVHRIESIYMLKRDPEMEGKSLVPGESDERANHVRAG